MMRVLIIMAIAVPAGPATGKNVVPGITKAPHPMMQLKDRAHTSSFDKYYERPV